MTDGCGHLRPRPVPVALAFWDLFETVIVPRPTPGWFRIGRYSCAARGACCGRSATDDPGASHDRVLGLFAPAETVALLVAWLVTLIVGYGLILYALRDELRPVPPDLGTAVYFAATSVLTLGFGDIVADGALARRSSSRPRRSPGSARSPSS